MGRNNHERGAMCLFSLYATSFSPLAVALLSLFQNFQPQSQVSQLEHAKSPARGNTLVRCEAPRSRWSPTAETTDWRKRVENHSMTTLALDLHHLSDVHASEAPTNKGEAPSNHDFLCHGCISCIPARRAAKSTDVTSCPPIGPNPKTHKLLGRDQGAGRMRQTGYYAALVADLAAPDSSVEVHGQAERTK